MIKLSFKVKMALWQTLIWFILSVIVSFAVLMMYQWILEKSNENLLITIVNEKAEDDWGMYDFLDEYLDSSDSSDSSDTQSGEEKEKGVSWLYQNDVMLFIYDLDGNRITTHSMFSKSELEMLDSLTVGNNGSVNGAWLSDDESYLYYDRLSESGEYYIRGITYNVTNIKELALGAISYKRMFLMAFIMLLLLSFSVGYFMTKRFLKPINKISQTAREIQSSGDLSKRIALDGRGDELHQLAGSFNSMFENLEKNFEAEKQFTSNASHELRTPVAVILAQSEYALEDAENIDELYECIEAIQKQGYKMSHLIEALLMFTRIDQRTDMYTKEQTNITALITDICDDYRLLGEKNIRMTAELEPDVYMNANAELFSLMVSNLIKNAYRYGRQNGNVRVKLEKRNGTVSISVTDDGSGISPDDLTHIWERFYRGDKARHGKGLGLGLPLAKQIAEFHGGKIEVRSELGMGSEFEIRLSSE